ncbi:hypothetical protein [Sphingopyxis macrogoltabida]|uniref:Uncharacterized protein n=1 Tax=Sphingopyxis macrogoltabida TaxID=33050 RepID=A0AAC8Z0B1_SPHMC|nr:hypothetical protein [Sphingopyxis macrogoltabida]ALJ12925.1 hypothetical protein LH19_08580 [Sphingopyxis macrogoltabida]AMU89608.1 hypothetical protein ATM17_11260 [Sphingopyxis macrogoltabida]
MTKNVFRSIIAAVIGIVVAFGLIWLAQYAGSEISPDAFDPDTGEVLIPVGSTIALLVGWFAGTFAGGWIAMRASAGTGAGWVVAGAVIGAALYRAATLDDAWWIMALGALVPLAAVWFAQRVAGTAAD